MGRLTLIADSTQISAFDECPQLHDYEYAQSLVQINQTDPDLTFQIPDKIAMGSLGHKYLEIYYRSKGMGSDLAFSARNALDFDPDKEDKIDPEFPLARENRDKVRNRFKDYLMTYGGNDYEIATKRHLEVIVRNGLPCDVAVDRPIVEQGFAYPLLDTSEYLFVLEGKIDLMCHSRGELFWLDHKWQQRKRLLYRKSIQFRNYALATGLPLGMINYVRLAEKVDKDTFVRDPITFTPGEMHAWKEELTEIFIRMAKARSASAPGELERHRSACPGKFGNPCKYIPLCDIPYKDQRLAHQKMFYTKGREWRPW